MKWGYRRIAASTENGGETKIQEALAAGWEPFAVTVMRLSGVWVEVLHLRRRQEAQ